MTLSDSVRDYCKTHLIAPARERGETTVSIRAGDIHAALGFKNRVPLVCSALDTTVFEQFAQVCRISVEGPTSGANAVFKFRLT